MGQVKQDAGSCVIIIMVQITVIVICQVSVNNACHIAYCYYNVRPCVYGPFNFHTPISGGSRGGTRG